MAEVEVAVDELAVQGISMIVERLGERAGDGEGEETEVVGVKAAGGGAREAVGGAVVEARAADAAVELAEEADDARVRAAQRLRDEEDDTVAFGERVCVEAIVRGDEAFTGGVLERALRRVAALLAAEVLPAQPLCRAAEGDMVALVGGGGAAALLGAVAEGGGLLQDAVALGLVEGGGVAKLDDVGHVRGVEVGVAGEGGAAGGGGVVALVAELDGAVSLREVDQLLH